MRILAALAAAAALASPAGAAGLWDHYGSAIRTNTGYLEQLAATARAEEDPAIGWASLLPQVSASDILSRQEAENSGDDTRSRTQSLTLTQTIFNLTSVDQLRATYDTRDAARLRAEAARSALMIQVADAYFNALLTRQLIDFTGARLRATREQLSSIERNLEAGTATLVELLSVQAELQSVIADEIAARGDHQLALRDLALVSGLDDPAIDPVDAAAPGETGESLDSLRARARQGNLAVQALRKDREATAKGVSATRDAVLPTVDFSMTRSRSWGNSSAREYDTTSRFALSWSLFSGGGTLPAYRQALADLDAADIRLRGGLRSIDNETERALNQVRNSESTIRALEASVKANEELLEIVTLGYDEGVNALTDVFDAQRDLEDSRSQLAQERYALLTNSLSLLDVIGALDEERFERFARSAGRPR